MRGIGLAAFALMAGSADAAVIIKTNQVSICVTDVKHPDACKAVAAYGQRPAVLAAAGTATGALIQSSNGITFILVSMVSAGLLPMVTAMPLLLWANLGTSALVIAASIDLRIMTLLALGVAGIWLFIDRKVGTTRRQVLEAVLAEEA